MLSTKRPTAQTAEFFPQNEWVAQYLRRPPAFNHFTQMQDMRWFLTLPKAATSQAYPLDVMFFWITPNTGKSHNTYVNEWQAIEQILSRIHKLYVLHQGDKLLKNGHPWRMWVDFWPQNVRMLSRTRIVIYSNLSKDQLEFAQTKSSFYPIATQGGVVQECKKDTSTLVQNLNNEEKIKAVKSSPAHSSDILQGPKMFSRFWEQLYGWEEDEWKEDDTHAANHVPTVVDTPAEHTVAENMPVVIGEPIDE